MTNVDEIQQHYSERLGRVLDGFENTKGAIRSDTELSETERAERAFAAHDEYSPQYAEAVAARNAAFEAREAEINSELFGAPAGSSSGTVAFNASLGRALDADDETLAEYARTAALTGDEYLGKAVLVVAARRGALARALPYVNSNPEVLALFRELQSIPDAATRERTARSSLPIPSLDSLKPDARTVMDHERSEAVRRARLRTLG